MLVRSPFAVSSHSWSMCMCSDYTIFSFWFSSFVATQIFHVLRIHTTYIFTFIRSDPSSTLAFFSFARASQHQHILLVLMLCIYFCTSVWWDKEEEEKRIDGAKRAFPHTYLAPSIFTLHQFKREKEKMEKKMQIYRDDATRTEQLHSSIFM